MSTIKKTAILILAGGESKRMGFAKQLLPWKNSNLLGNAIQQGLASNADAVFVVLGARYQEIKQSIDHFSITIVENNQWESGMGTSIACGINYILNDSIHYESIIISLSDTPFIDKNHFNSLINTLAQSDKKIIATKSNSIIGVPAIFSSKHIKELLLLDDDRGAKQIIKRHKEDVFIIDIDKKGQDIDTMEDYKRLLNK